MCMEVQSGSYWEETLRCIRIGHDLGKPGINFSNNYIDISAELHVVYIGLRKRNGDANKSSVHVQCLKCAQTSSTETEGCTAYKAPFSTTTKYGIAHSYSLPL